MKKIAIIVFVIGLIFSCCNQTVPPTEVETDSIEVVDSIMVDSIVVN